MPTPPYARLGVRVDGGAPQYGGITASHGATVQLTYESTAYWGSPAAVVDIYDYPDGWSGPGAPWVTTLVPQANGLPDREIYRYVGNSPPPAFVLPADPLWGKFMFSLVVLGGLKNGVTSSELTDVQTAIQILSPLNLEVVAFRELTQFGGWRSWAGAITRMVRAIEDAITTFVGAFVPSSRTLTAGPGLTGGGDLSADRTFAVGVISDLQHGSRSGGTTHSVAVASGDAGFLSGTDKAKLDNSATVATSNTLALRGASGEISFTRVYGSGTVNTTAFIGMGRNVVGIGFKTLGGQNHPFVTEDGADGFVMGSDSHTAGWVENVKPTGVFGWQVGGNSVATLNDITLQLFTAIVASRSNAARFIAGTDLLSGSRGGATLDNRIDGDYITTVDATPTQVAYYPITERASVQLTITVMAKDSTTRDTKWFTRVVRARQEGGTATIYGNQTPYADDDDGGTVAGVSISIGTSADAIEVIGTGIGSDVDWYTRVDSTTLIQ